MLATTLSVSAWPNYYMGVHWRPGIMPCTTSSCRTYTALGGSNTCGHGLRLQYNAFQTLIFEGLKKRGRGEFTLQPSCVPAMGPDYPASCLDYFAPNTTAFATLEFTPNMGETRELNRNEAHLTHMAHSLLRRGVKVVLVSLVPRPPTCERCIAMFEAGHDRVARIASQTRIPIVTVVYDAKLWSDDLKHLNEEGHRLVANRVLDHFLMDDSEKGGNNNGGGGEKRARRKSLRNAAASDAAAAPSLPPLNDDGDSNSLPTCVFGPDLPSMMLPGSRGFNLTYVVGKHRDKPGLLTTTADSLLRLCVKGLPASFGLSLALERSDFMPMSNVSLGCEAPCHCPLELLSNGDWTLRYNGKGRRRATESYMHRVFGARHGIANDGGGLPAHNCDCVITMRNTPLAGDVNARAKINGLVAGGSGAIGWANRFHMNLNPTVLSGR